MNIIENNYAIEVKNVKKTYRNNVKALDGLSFSVKQGIIFGLLGPNGAGKSTTVKILTTLSRPDSGEAKVEGIDVVRYPDKARKVIGCVSQKSGVFFDGTGRENLILQGQLYGLNGTALNRRVDELLEAFKLLEAADRSTITYSGGMLRKLDIAMGLIHHPKILFLDEPTTGLDPESRSTLWEAISSLSKKEKVTVLLTTHYLEEVDHLADRLAIIDKGNVVVEGTPGELKEELNGDIIKIELLEEYSKQTSQIQSILLKQKGINKVELQAKLLQLQVSSGSTVLPSILQMLDTSSIKVMSAVVVPPSLDEVYLKYTGKSFDN